MIEERTLSVTGAGAGDSSPMGGAKERTPEVIGAEIRMYVDAGRRVTLLCGIEIGRRLVEAKEKIKALEEELKRAGEQKAAAEKTLAELKAKAEAADRAGADSEALKKQVEGLQKQLALAAPEVSAFKAAFDRAQDELVHAEMALKEIRDEEIREKVRRAFTAMLEGFLERVKG